MICYLATAFLAIGAVSASPQLPQWEASYGRALKAARAGDAPLLVVLDKPKSRSARLQPALLSTSSADKKAIDLLRPYELCHVDVTTKYGQKVAKAFNAKSFPHVSIIDKTGTMVIFSKSGEIAEAEWERVLTRHKSGDRSLAKAVSRTSYKRSVNPSNVLRPSCPNCQRNSF